MISPVTVSLMGYKGKTGIAVGCSGRLFSFPVSVNTLYFSYVCFSVPPGVLKLSHNEVLCRFSTSFLSNMCLRL